jgi:hypothetical protein
MTLKGITWFDEEFGLEFRTKNESVCDLTFWIWKKILNNNHQTSCQSFANISNMSVCFCQKMLKPHNGVTLNLINVKIIISYCYQKWYIPKWSLNFCFILTLYNSEVCIFYFKNCFWKWQNFLTFDPYILQSWFLQFWNWHNKLNTICLINFSVRSIWNNVFFSIVLY